MVRQHRATVLQMVAQKPVLRFIRLSWWINQSNKYYYYNIITTHEANGTTFALVVLCVCLSVCSCCNFQKHWPRNLTFGTEYTFGVAN